MQRQSKPETRHEHSRGWFRLPIGHGAGPREDEDYIIGVVDIMLEKRRRGDKENKANIFRESASVILVKTSREFSGLEW